MEEHSRPRAMTQAARTTLEIFVRHPGLHQEESAEGRRGPAAVERSQCRAERVLRDAMKGSCPPDSIRWATVISCVDRPTRAALTVLALPVEILADPAFRLEEAALTSGTVEVHIDMALAADEVIAYGGAARHRIFVPPDDIRHGPAAETYQQLRADGTSPIVAADVARTVGHGR